jgi:hypothetical protein
MNGIMIMIIFHLILPTVLVSISLLFVFLSLIGIKEFQKNRLVIIIIAAFVLFVSLWLYGLFNGVPTPVNCIKGVLK